MGTRNPLCHKDSVAPPHGYFVGGGAVDGLGPRGGRPGSGRPTDTGAPAGLFAGAESPRADLEVVAARRHPPSLVYDPHSVN